MKRCPYCVNGRVPAGWNYPAHRCPDCDGTGWVEDDEEEELEEEREEE